jgi:hypothetical protein
MRDFIQNRLRVLLEVKQDVNVINKPTSYEPKIDIPVKSGLRVPVSLTYSHEKGGLSADKMVNMIDDAKQFAEDFKKLNPEDGMALSHDSGVDGSGYEYKLYKRLDGKFNFIGKPTTRNFEAGEYNLYGGTAGKILYMYTKACSKYPTAETENCISLTNRENPMIDAKIKLLSDQNISDAILSFIGKEVGYLDDKGEEIRKAKMTPDEIAKLAGKEGRYKKKAASKVVGYFGNEENNRNRQSELTNKKYNMGGLSKEEELELKNIKLALKGADKDRNDRFSKNL